MEKEKELGGSKRSLSPELLLSRIEMYKQRLSESKTLSNKDFKMMLSALLGVKLIIADLMIDNEH